MPNRYRGELAVPELGDGYTMLCDMEAVGAMETALGTYEFHQKVLFALPYCAPSILRLFLGNAIWKDGKRTPAEWPIGEPFDRLAKYCEDAFIYAMRGKLHAEWVASEEAKKTVTENPTKGTAA
jgi:hypothetical protein